MALSSEQRTTLSILGYLYYRMGRIDSAVTVFAALAAQAPEPADAVTLRALATLAAIETERGNGEKALQLLHRVMDGRTLSTRHAALHLLRARALWQQGRKDEARAAVNEYLYLAGGSSLAKPPVNGMGKRI